VSEAAAEIEKVARLSHGRLVATLAIRTGSVQAAADALSDALLRALETWPRRGVPEKPEAWLIAAAKNRHSDTRRHDRVAAAAQAHLVRLEEERAASNDGAMPDHMLNLLFVCAHPAIAAPVRTPLMLQVVLGLDAKRMSGAFLVSPGTLGQRLTRARAKIETAGIGFALPSPDDLKPRLGHVLDAIYAAYTVGADGHAAGDAKGAPLAREAIWLGSVLASRMPREPEAQALLALMLYAEARRPARSGSDGAFIPLDEQDPALWNRKMLDDADLAMRLAIPNASLGRYQIEAAIQAAHANRGRGYATDWTAIAALYRGLVALHPSIGAVTGLAAALGETGQAEEALAILGDIPPERTARYQPWWAVRAHLLRGRGDRAAASMAYDRAIALASDPSIRAFLSQRKAQMQST
jgi:RNA polymerase sigma-70 factor (ECF subfamily)